MCCLVYKHWYKVKKKKNVLSTNTDLWCVLSTNTDLRCLQTQIWDVLSTDIFYVLSTNTDRWCVLSTDRFMKCLVAGNLMAPSLMSVPKKICQHSHSPLMHHRHQLPQLPVSTILNPTQSKLCWHHSQLSLSTDCINSQSYNPEQD